MFEKEAKNYAEDCEKEFHTSYGACLCSFQAVQSSAITRLMNGIIQKMVIIRKNMKIY